MIDLRLAKAVVAAWPNTSIRSEPDALERRIAPRFSVLEYRAWMGRMDGEEFVANAVRLLDISQGGACVESHETAPVGAEVWLCLVCEGQERDSVAGEVVRVDRGTQGQYRTRIAFWEPCPRRLYREAIDGIRSWSADT